MHILTHNGGDRARHVLSPRLRAVDSAVRLQPIRSACAASGWRHTGVHVESVVGGGGGGGVGEGCWQRLCLRFFLFFSVASNVCA